MTEQNFQVPPIPKAPTPTQPFSGASQQPITPLSSSPEFPKPHYTNGEMSSPSNHKSEELNSTEKTGMITDLGLPPQLLQTKIVVSILVGILFFGVILGSLIFGGGNSAPVQNSGLTGVIRNPEIKRNIARCGIADKTAACVLYIVNASRNDRLAQDFLDEAVKLTGRQKYLLSIENSQYTKTRIPPGHFAQIKIPAMK